MKNNLTLNRRQALALAMFTLPLAACASNSEDSRASASSSPSVPVGEDIPLSVPSMFEKHARWVADLVQGTVPVDCVSGLAMVIPGRNKQDGSLFRIELRSANSGELLWTSDDIVAISGVSPRLEYINFGGVPWVVLQQGKDLSFYRVEGSGDRFMPEFSVKAPDGASDPVVREYGIAYPGSGGSRVDFGSKALKKFDHEGNVLGAWGTAFLVERGGVISYRGDDDSEIWSAKVPDGASGTASFKAFGKGYVVLAWNDVWQVLDVALGKSLTSGKPDGGTVAVPDGSEVLASDFSNRWVVLGNLAFDLQQNKVHALQLQGGKGNCIYRDIVFVDKATKPIRANGDTSGSGTDFAGMVDASTGGALTNDSIEAVPKFISSSSQGVFVVENSQAKSAKVYSTTLV